MVELKMEKYHSIASTLRALRKLVKAHDENEAQSLEDTAMKFMEQMKKAYAEDGNSNWVTDAIVQCGILEVIDMFLDAYTWRKEAAVNYEDASTSVKGKRLLICYDSTLRCVVEATYRHVSVCVYAIEKGVIEAIMSELEKPALLKQRCLPCDFLLADIAKDFIMILGNISVRTSMGVSKLSKDNNHVLKKYCDGDNYELIEMALFTLSRVASENEKISMSFGLADFIVRLLKAALSGNFSGFSIVTTAASLLESLCQVANCSDNCVTKIVNAGVLDVLDAILLAPTPKLDPNADQLEHEPPSDPALLVQCTSDVEKLLTIKLLYMAKFTKDVRKIISSRRSTVAALKRLAKTSHQGEIKREARNLLASLFAARPEKPRLAEKNDEITQSDKRRVSARLLDRRRQQDARTLQSSPKPSLDNDAKQTLGVSTESKRDRIFVSYSHKQQQLVFSIVDKLRAAGFKNVITDQSIESDWYTWMVEQVEQADIVLVCFSESYYQSGNCKDEATNARALGKTIIPLKMEDYTPISWLGGITRVRLWRDYWNPSTFDDSVSKLIEELKTFIDSQEKAKPPESTASKQVEAKIERALSHASVVPTQSAVSLFKTAPSDVEQLANIKSWDQLRSKLWLTSIGYPPNEVPIGAVDGTFVCTLVQLARKEPKYLMKLLLQHKGLSLDQAVVTVGKLSDGPKVF